MSAASFEPSFPQTAASLKGRTARRRAGAGTIALVIASAALAACGASSPKPKVASASAAPSKPVVETVPYRPMPPGGADYVMAMPGRGVDGRWQTVNTNLTDDQLVWNMRSAWNVAALNCLDARYQPILDGYSAFLKRNTKPLKAVNDRLEKTYGARYKSRREAMVARDGYTTKVYNFFSLPPARTPFCEAALTMSQQALQSPPKDPLSFSRTHFDGMLAPFDQFYNDYEAYQVASAQWDAQYGAKHGPSQPGWVAVHQAHAGSAAPSR
jgi:hypothetical protein